MSVLFKFEEDTFVYIFSFLTPNNLLKVSHTCRELYKICSQDYFWKQYCLDYADIRPLETKSFKEYFYNYVFLKRGQIESKIGLKVVSITIGIIGEIGSGRESLIQRFLNEKFEQKDIYNYQKIVNYTLYLYNKETRVIVMAEKMDIMNEKNYFHYRDGIFLCIDLSNEYKRKELLENLSKQLSDNSRRYLIIGTKNDKNIPITLDLPLN